MYWSEDSDGKRTRVRSADKGFLLLEGAHPADTIVVPVSLAMLESSAASIEEFFADPRQNRRTLYTVTNWKFGFFLMLPFCLLILYIPSRALLQFARAAIERLRSSTRSIC